MPRNQRRENALPCGQTTIPWGGVFGSGKPVDNATRNVPRGPWDEATPYGQGDIVTYNGSSYLAGENIPAGTSPTDAVYWDLLAAEGPAGVAGGPGTNGQPAYFHVAYADSADGSVDFIAGMANPGRTYIGIYTDTNASGSSDYQAYYWSRLTGQDGVNGVNGTPGPIGANGAQTYVHFAYADAADGSVNFAVGNPGTRKYIGVYSDYTSASSNSNSAYTWSLIKGADGAPGGVGGPGPSGTNGIDGLAALNIHTVGAVSWDGHNLLSTANAVNWTTNGAYSGNTIPGGVLLSFQRPNLYGNEDAFVGISSSPTASIDYPAVEFAWRHGENTGMDSNTYDAEVWHAGTMLWNEAWNGANTYSIRYDVSTGVVTWYRNEVAVYTYNAGTNRAFGIEVTAARNMSVANLAFAGAGGTGAPGAPGPPGQSGTDGVSPSPSYPAISLTGTGTFTYPNVIPLNGGQTMTLNGSINFSVQRGQSVITLQLQYSLDNGSSWTVLASGSDTAYGGGGADPPEPGGADAQGQYTNGNSSSAKAVVSIRAVVSGGSSGTSYFGGVLQPS